MRINDARRHPRLALSAPPEWERRYTTSAHSGVDEAKSDHSDDDMADDRMEFVVAPDVIVHVRRMVPMWVDYGSWVENAIGETFSSPILEQVAFEHGLSTRGWPMVFAHYRVRSTSGDLLAECVGVFYRILHVGAEVVVRFSGGTRWAAFEGALRPVLMNGHIDWPRSEPDDLYTLLGIET